LAIESDTRNGESASPAERTVGQLVADAIRFYGSRFFPCLALGSVVAVFNQFAIGLGRGPQAVLLLAAAPFFTLAYIGACLLVSGERPSRRALVTAFGVGVIVFVPVAALVLAYILPALVWLALMGLSVPVALLEGRGFLQSMHRARRLASAGFIHALGSLATLVILFFISRTALLVLLHGQADTALRTAAVLADVVLSPLLFLGSALLYFDQKEREDKARVSRR
jgi:hypothetical protein